eukprot:gene44056-24919_t
MPAVPGGAERRCAELAALLQSSNFPPTLRYAPLPYAAHRYAPLRHDTHRYPTKGALLLRALRERGQRAA